MGNEAKESVVDEMQEMLGLGEEESEQQEEPEQETEESQTEETEEETEEESEPKLETTAVTQEQIDLNKEMAKLDVKIEELESKSVDVDAFYANITDHLTEDEQQLEFDDKPAYMKLVNKKLNAYEKEHAPSDEIEKLKEQKKELEGVYERQSAIIEVSNRYPDYNHEKIMEYFQNDLSKKEQDAIFADSNSYADVYENTYKKFKGVNPTKVKSEKAPNIPNVDKVRKTVTSTKEIGDALADEEEQLKEALGL